ncbi:Lrp/AsnC family transcriptional regulator [Microbulbifer agarilyticus]|uniref:Transcription regulator AsnC/Lrp ligand binding domain-containing protein n=1 Tax=Microbulbifer agarilyticus TaxID=260552 RepID=A0A1Q2M2Z3_9GAMM|nr:Lrp/AsnC family transcriptional regulator [Microbulbifer agarilyticus]AQQ67026.1 hypothetical protein Mag101_04755 [Microbulbifer agarilyticus]MBY6190600.1 Lrp/AsnC family transcriptional regulator [Microbulbifer agarilyticus]
MDKSDFKFDRVSKRIIQELQKNARISNRDLAEKVNLSPSACLKRTKKLEEQGYIRHYTVELDLNRVCTSVMAMAQLAIGDNRGRAAEVNIEAAIRKLPQAVECFKTSGEYQYLVHFICRDLEEYNEISNRLLEQDLGISRISSNFVLSTPKPFQSYPLGELEWLNDMDERGS